MLTIPKKGFSDSGNGVSFNDDDYGGSGGGGLDTADTLTYLT